MIFRTVDIAKGFRNIGGASLPPFQNILLSSKKKPPKSGIHQIFKRPLNPSESKGRSKGSLERLRIEGLWV